MNDHSINSINSIISYKNSNVKVLGHRALLPMSVLSHFPNSQLTGSPPTTPSEDNAVWKFTGKQLRASVASQKVKEKALVWYYNPLDFSPVFKRKGAMLYVGRKGYLSARARWSLELSSYEINHYIKTLYPTK